MITTHIELFHLNTELIYPKHCNEIFYYYFFSHLTWYDKAYTGCLYDFNFLGGCVYFMGKYIATFPWIIYILVIYLDGGIF